MVVVVVDRKSLGEHFPCIGIGWQMLKVESGLEVRRPDAVLFINPAWVTPAYVKR